MNVLEFMKNINAHFKIPRKSNRDPNSDKLQQKNVEREKSSKQEKIMTSCTSGAID